MKLYKITDRFGRTYNRTQWFPGFTHKVDFSGEMCSEGCLHAYKGPYSAIMFCSFHNVDYKGLQLWEAEGEPWLDDGTKVGLSKLTITKRVVPPSKPTKTQLRAFATLCVLEMPMTNDNPEWQNWAINWISNKDRTYTTAKKVYLETRNSRSLGDPISMATWMAMLIGTQMAMLTATAVSIAMQVFRETEGEIDIEALAKLAMTKY